jgi:effector-binding domain-containing protein
MYRKILIGLAILLVGLSILSIAMNKTYTATTTMTIKSPPNYVLNALNNLSLQDKLYSKATLDTSFRLQCPGNVSNAGSSCDYVSQKYGNGVLRITALNDKDSIVLLDEGNNGHLIQYEYKIENGDQNESDVSVRASAQSGFMSNLWNFIHKWKLKKQVHQSLENLNAVTTARYQSGIYNGYKINEISRNQKFYIVNRSKVKFENMAEYFSKNISGLYQKALHNKLTISGMPTGLFFEWNESDKISDMAAALPTLAEFNIADSESINLPPHQAILIEYKGESSKSGMAHLSMDEYMKDRRLKNVPPVIEEYLTDPAKEPDPSKWITHIIYQVKPL